MSGPGDSASAEGVIESLSAGYAAATVAGLSALRDEDEGTRKRTLRDLRDAATERPSAFEGVVDALAADVTITQPRYAFYPVLWTTVGAAAVWHAPDATGSRRRRALAATVAVAYLAVLLWFTGTVYVMPEWMYSLSVHGGLPGWAPIVGFMLGPIGANVVPFVVAGYLALAYLTYVALTRATRGLAAAVLGPATCVGCVAAGVSGLLALAGGTGVSVAFAGTSASAVPFGGAAYDAATVVYLVAVAALALVD